MNRMRFAVDAHAIGRRLTGNEVYVRSLLREFAELDRASDFVACVSGPGAGEWMGRRGKDEHGVPLVWTMAIITLP